MKKSSSNPKYFFIDLNVVKNHPWSAFTDRLAVEIDVLRTGRQASVLKIRLTGLIGNLKMLQKKLLVLLEMEMRFQKVQDDFRFLIQCITWWSLLSFSAQFFLQIWFLFNCSFINLIFFWMGGTKRKSISRLRKRRACHTAEASFFHILRFGNSIYTRNAILFLFKELTVWPNRQEVPLCPAFPWKFMCL